MNQEVLQAIKGRRSVRAYKPEQIKEEELAAVLECGSYAATGMGIQHTKMVAVQDKETIALLSRLNAQVMGRDADPFYGAPTVIVVFSDPERGTCVEDGALVMGNLMLGAYAAGLGSCWIHRARQVFETEEGKALMEKWGVPKHYIGIGNCIVGYAAGELPQAKPRKAENIIRA